MGYKNYVKIELVIWRVRNFCLNDRSLRIFYKLAHNKILYLSIREDMAIKPPSTRRLRTEEPEFQGEDGNSLISLDEASARIATSELGNVPPDSFAMTRSLPLPLSKSDLGVVKLELDLETRKLEWIKLHGKPDFSLGVLTNTSFGRHYSLWLQILDRLSPEAVRSVGVFGLGLDSEGQSNEAFELATIFSNANVFGFDLNQTALQFLNDRYDKRFRVNPVYNEYFVQNSESFARLQDYLARFGTDVARFRSGEPIEISTEAKKRVSAQYLNFLTMSLPTQFSFDFISCLHTLRYLLLRDTPLHRVKSFLIELLAALNPDGQAVINNSFAFKGLSLSRKQLKALGVVAEKLDFKPLDANGNWDDDHCYLLRKVGRGSDLLQDLSGRIREVYSRSLHVDNRCMPGASFLSSPGAVPPPMLYQSAALYRSSPKLMLATRRNVHQKVPGRI